MLRARASDIWIGVVALVEDLGEVLPGLAGSGLEQGDGAVARLRHDPGREDPGALGLGAWGQRLGTRRGGECEDAHGGVVVIEHRALGRLVDQFREGWGQTGRRLRDDIPLGGGR